MGKGKREREKMREREGEILSWFGKTERGRIDEKERKRNETEGEGEGEKGRLQLRLQKIQETEKETQVPMRSIRERERGRETLERVPEICFPQHSRAPKKNKKKRRVVVEKSALHFLSLSLISPPSLPHPNPTPLPSFTQLTRMTIPIPSLINPPLSLLRREVVADSIESFEVPSLNGVERGGNEDETHGYGGT